MGCTMSVAVFPIENRRNWNIDISLTEISKTHPRIALLLRHYFVGSPRALFFDNAFSVP